MTMYYRGILPASPLWQWLVLARRNTEPMDTRAGKGRSRIAAQTSSKRSHASSYRVWTWAFPLQLCRPLAFIIVSGLSLGPFARPCRPSTPLSGVVRRAHALAHEQGSSVSSNRLPLLCCIRVVRCKYFVLYRTYPPLVDQSREVRVRLTCGPLSPDELRCGVWAGHEFRGSCTIGFGAKPAALTKIPDVGRESPELSSTQRPSSHNMQRTGTAVHTSQDHTAGDAYSMKLRGFHRSSCTREVFRSREKYPLSPAHSLRLPLELRGVDARVCLSRVLTSCLPPPRLPSSAWDPVLQDLR